MISILIVAKDLKDPKMIKCLNSIKAQSYKDYELIIESGGNIQEARKRGIAKAKGDWICLIDSDQVAHPDLLLNCLTYCEKYTYNACTWIERSLKPRTFMEKVIDYDKKLFHEAYDDDPVLGAAEPRFFKARFLKRLDWDKLPPITFELTFINKQISDMGAKIGFLFETLAWHHEPKNTIQLFKKFFRYGYYYLPALAIDRETILQHSKPRRVYYSWRAISRPILYVGLWYHYFIKGIASGLGILSCYLNKGVK